MEICPAPTIHESSGMRSAQAFCARILRIATARFSMELGYVGGILAALRAVPIDPLQRFPTQLAAGDGAITCFGVMRGWWLLRAGRTETSVSPTEDARLTTSGRVANYIALCCVVAWRISCSPILLGQAPARSSEAVFTCPERILLERALLQKRKNAPRALAFYMIALARLGESVLHCCLHASLQCRGHSPAVVA